MNSSSEIDLDLTQPFEPSLEADKSCNDEHVQSDDDIFFMPTQPFEEPFNEKSVNSTITDTVSEANLEPYISHGEGSRQENIEDVLSNPKTEICDMETQVFEVQLPINQTHNLDSKLSPSIKGKTRLKSRASRKSSRMSIPNWMDNPSNSIFINSSESEDDIALNESNYRESNPIQLVQETPLNKVKRDISYISTEEDFDVTQKIDGFVCNESTIFPSLLKETPTTLGLSLSFQETKSLLNKTNETSQYPQVDSQNIECTSPVLFEGCFDEVSSPPQSLNITETPLRHPRTQKPMNKSAAEVLSSASNPNSSTKQSLSRDSDGMIGSPILLGISPEDNVRFSTQKLDISEADTQPFGNISIPFDLTEAETQPIVKTLYSRKTCQDNILQNTSNKVVDITEAETQPFIFSPPRVSSKCILKKNVHASQNTQNFNEEMYIHQDSSSSSTLIPRQETIITSPSKDSNHTHPLIHNLELSGLPPGLNLCNNHKTIARSIGTRSDISPSDCSPTNKLESSENYNRDSSYNHPSTQKLILPESGDSNDEYPPTQKLITETNAEITVEHYDEFPPAQKLVTETDVEVTAENSNDEYPPTQKLVFPECEDSNDGYSPTQKLVIESDIEATGEDSSDEYPPTQKLVFPECEDSNDGYSPTQKLVIESDIEATGEDSSDEYPPTQKLVFPECEDSNDGYPPTQKLVIEPNIEIAGEDSSDDYLPTQKLVIEPNIEIAGEGSNDNYPPTQKLVTESNIEIAGEGSNDNYPPTQKLVTETNTEIAGEDSSDGYLPTQKLVIEPNIEIAGKGSNDNYPPIQRLMIEPNTEIAGEGSNDNYPPTQKLVTETNTEIAGKDSSDGYLPTQKLVIESNIEIAGEGSNDNFPPTQKLVTKLNAEIAGDSSGDYTVTQRLESSHSSCIRSNLERSNSPKKIDPEIFDIDENKNSFSVSDEDLLPKSPILDMGCADPHPVPSLKDLCSKIMNSEALIRIKFPLLSENEIKEFDSSAMDIETQSFSPVFIVNPLPLTSKLSELGINQLTAEDEPNKKVDSSSMEIEPSSFSANFPLTASQKTTSKSETSQTIHDVHSLLRSSTPIPEDLHKLHMKVRSKDHFYFLLIFILIFFLNRKISFASRI